MTIRDTILEKLLGTGSDGQITYWEAMLRSPWPAAILAGLVVAAAIYTAWLYHRERALSHRARVLLGVCRAVVLGIVLVLLFEPILAIEMKVQLPRTLLVLMDTSQSMATKDPRKTPRELHEAAVTIDAAAYGSDPSALDEEARRRAAAVPRIELAKKLLGGNRLDLLGQLGRTHVLRYFRFGEGLTPTEGKGETVPDGIQDAQATDQATRLGDAIEEAVERYSGQSVAGLVLVTDGAANEGVEPLEAARRMKDRGVPLYLVGIGLPEPPDVRIQNVIVPENVFPRDVVPVRVQFASRGYRNQVVEVRVLLDGQKVAARSIVLKDQPQFEELSFSPASKSGKVKLAVEITELPGEISTADNRVIKELNVIDKKIKVLYVEGQPRWEFRYLKRVLERDYRLDVKFLMTQGDRDLAGGSKQYLASFPDNALSAFEYDLVILGDVPSSYFSPAQLSRIEELVRKHAGSLLMIAGDQHAPMTYAGTAVEPLLPVRPARGEPRDVDDQACPSVTEAGELSAITSLESPRDKNQARWGNVKPLYKLPPLGGAKPGATVLAEIRGGSREPYPLIAWQRFGTGKTLYVGSDQIWRLRFMTGSKYHARFWGQAIQFLTLSRLLGEDRRIRLELTPGGQGPGTPYRTGERMEITAAVLNDSYEPIKSPAYSVFVEPVDRKGGKTEVRLKPVPATAGLYQAYFIPSQEGRYVLKTPPADEAASHPVDFSVTKASLEALEPAMQEDLLKRMAAASGGRYFSLEEAPELLKVAAAETRSVAVRKERDLWNLPAVLGTILVLLAGEWFFRRRWDLV